MENFQSLLYVFFAYLLGSIPFGYIFSKQIYHLYAVQFLYGVGAGFAYPSWSSLFTSHLEKGKRGFQWSIYSSGVGAGTAVAAATGAWIAQITDFRIVFLITGFFSILGLIILFFLEKKSLKKF